MLQSIMCTFQNRMNLPEILSDHWDIEARAYAAAAAALPSRTEDTTVERTFSKLWIGDDVGEWKGFAQRKRKRGKAQGLDDIAIDTIMRIPNDILTDFFNKCLATLDAPGIWFTTILTGVLKANKSALDPENYRIIGLQSCFLKVFTWLIDRCFRAWLETNNILPPSQNGF
ncbi:hypothetical protein ARMGADRAFT_1092564 [Armillaria gallica]|uniref:Reverse transcriptase domain-containing protein n=1 Tax=Armillaria gallica TaxID=47427 RepID=A0A2H3CAC7_ARMGA|nr:hypothetical protein ARMGADRAFT_1092564 [Armillaria gallica]